MTNMVDRAGGVYEWVYADEDRRGVVYKIGKHIEDLMTVPSDVSKLFSAYPKAVYAEVAVIDGWYTATGRYGSHDQVAHGDGLIVATK